MPESASELRISEIYRDIFVDEKKGDWFVFGRSNYRTVVYCRSLCCQIYETDDQRHNVWVIRRFYTNSPECGGSIGAMPYGKMNEAMGEGRCDSK